MIYPQPPVVIEEERQPRRLVAQAGEAEHRVAGKGAADDLGQAAAGAEGPPKQTPAQPAQAQGFPQGRQSYWAAFCMATMSFR